MFPKEIVDAFTLLMATYWQFLSKDWPVLEKTKYHRSEVKPVKDIQHVKTYVLEHLGYIPVFFFLVELFANQEYPGPYSNVDKGLLIIYQLLTGCSIAHMARFIPSSSYHAIYNAFYTKYGEELNTCLDYCLRKMFSSTKLRIMCALHRNPEDFKHVTLMIDGHDSRATYINAADHAMFYSYKLKKSGFRTQVCTDVNGMVLFVSDAAPCSDNNDGSMLADMRLKKKISKYDCVVVDGGYTTFIDRIVANNRHLDRHNFVFPIRKSRGVGLKQEEVNYNSILGSFRSSIEATFGEIGTLFQRFNGKGVIRVTEMETFTVQFKLACLLANIKKFVNIGCVSSSEQHTFWMQPNFDFPNGSSKNVYDVVSTLTIAEKSQDAEMVKEIQQQFLSLGVNEDNGSDDEPIDEDLPQGHYEVEAIVGHRGPKHRREYLVRWVGYDESSNSWLSPNNFDDSDIIIEYEKDVRRRRKK
jgi:hypothetical protein